MVSSSSFSDSDSDDGFYRPFKTQTRRMQASSRTVEAHAPEPEPVPLALSQASDGPTLTQEARRLAHEDEVNPQKYAIIGDNESLRRAEAKVRLSVLPPCPLILRLGSCPQRDAEDRDFGASQLSRTSSASSGLTDRDGEGELADEVADLAEWDTELNDAVTTRAPSMARSATGDGTDVSSGEDEAMETEIEGGNGPRGFPEHLDGRDIVDFGCRWLLVRQQKEDNPHDLSARLRKDFGLDIVAFRKIQRFVAEHAKIWGSYVTDDPDFVLEVIKAEWRDLDEAGGPLIL